MGRTLSDSYSTVSQPVITVGTSSTAVLSANAARMYLLLVNDGTEACYVSIGGTATLSSGIRINSNGGSYEMASIYGNVFTGAITAICATGGLKLLVTEGA